MGLHLIKNGKAYEEIPTSHYQTLLSSLFVYVDKDDDNSLHINFLAKWFADEYTPYIYLIEMAAPTLEDLYNDLGKVTTMFVKTMDKLIKKSGPSNEKKFTINRMRLRIARQNNPFSTVIAKLYNNINYHGTSDLTNELLYIDNPLMNNFRRLACNNLYAALRIEANSYFDFSENKFMYADKDIDEVVGKDSNTKYIAMFPAYEQIIPAASVVHFIIETIATSMNKSQHIPKYFGFLGVSLLKERIELHHPHRMVLFRPFIPDVNSTAFISKIYPLYIKERDAYKVIYFISNPKIKRGTLVSNIDVYTLKTICNASEFLTYLELNAPEEFLKLWAINENKIHNIIKELRIKMPLVVTHVMKSRKLYTSTPSLSTPVKAEWFFSKSGNVEVKVLDSLESLHPNISRDNVCMGNMRDHIKMLQKYNFPAYVLQEGLSMCNYDSPYRRESENDVYFHRGYPLENAMFYNASAFLYEFLYQLHTQDNLVQPKLVEENTNAANNTTSWF